jgi:hypothetical protein
VKNRNRRRKIKEHSMEMKKKTRMKNTNLIRRKLKKWMKKMN